MALYYTSAGKLWRAVWEHWQQDGQGNVIPLTYAREKGKEFYYDGSRQRYLSRALDVSSEYPSQWKPTEEAQLWTDYLGDEPYGDFAVTETWNEPLQRWEITPPAEKLRYLGGYGTHAQQDAQTGATRYLHGDLIRSTMLTTDEGGLADETLAYTAFGEPVGPGGVGVPPGSDTRYRYAGGWGYEDDLLKLDGAPGTKPIVLLHVGWRWYQPNVARFIQRDPVGLHGGVNAYLYLRNAPLWRADPLGLLNPEGTWCPWCGRWHSGIRCEKAPPAPSPAWPKNVGTEQEARDIADRTAWTIACIAPFGGPVGCIVGGCAIIGAYAWDYYERKSEGLYDPRILP